MDRFPNAAAPMVGIAYSRYTPSFLEQHPDAIDYVEIPFELLRHNPAVAGTVAPKPIVLHCASLSMAGSVPAPRAMVDDVQSWIERTQTPWLGEHLSFITAERDPDGGFADEYAPGEPWNIGYTVGPPLNEKSVQFVLASLARAEAAFDVPVLLENPPVYFRMPGSTMSQADFISEICKRSDALLLLDLAHFCITAHTVGYDPMSEVMRLPLERVTEVHISGIDTDDHGQWDNHASRAPQVEFDLLGIVLEHAPVRGITLEYNWSSRFPATVLLDEISRARGVVAAV
jgi:uncharacterized protein (UPF0276 family)